MRHRHHLPTLDEVEGLANLFEAVATTTPRARIPVEPLPVMSHKAIAATLGMSVGMVARVEREALAKCRIWLLEEHGMGRDDMLG